MLGVPDRLAHIRTSARSKPLRSGLMTEPRLRRTVLILLS